MLYKGCLLMKMMTDEDRMSDDLKATHVDYTELPQHKPNDPPEDRYSRPVGGKDGFDDYVERCH